MKIKRFFAPDMRTAIRKVREAQGADAVILSSRNLEDGVEIISAVDFDQNKVNEMTDQRQQSQARSSAPYFAWDDGFEAPAQADSAAGAAAPTAATNDSLTADLPAWSHENWLQERGEQAGSMGTTAQSWAAGADLSSAARQSQDPSIIEMRRELASMRNLLQEQLAQLAWSDMARRDPLRAQLFKRLERLGLSEAVTTRVADRVTAPDDGDAAWNAAMASLAEQIPLSRTDFTEQGGVVALVGPTGVGKTTTIAKLAARFALRHGKQHLALISTDGYRVGAQRQLLTFGQILGVPVHLADDGPSLKRVVNELSGKRLILIDTAGMSQRDMGLNEQLATLQATPRASVLLVLAANIQQAVINEVVRGFGSMRLDGCIITKMDEAATLGAALSVVIERQLPLSWLGDGQRVPEDLHPARINRLLSEAVNLARRSQAESNPEPSGQSSSQEAYYAHV